MLPAAENERLDVPALETWHWDAACAIQGATDAPKFKDFILPLVFFKRLSDVFEDEFASCVEDYEDEAVARDIVEADLAHAMQKGTRPIIRFYIPAEHSWRAVRNHGADGRLGEFLTDALRSVARLNPDLLGVLDIKDYNERQLGQRTLDDDRPTCAAYKKLLGKYLPSEYSRVAYSPAHNDSEDLKACYLSENEEKKVRKDFVKRVRSLRY